MIQSDLRYLKKMRSRSTSAYTLVELLIVISILLLLTTIALPTVKTMLSDQKLARAARNLTAYIDKARSRAIAEERLFGILIERGPLASQSIRVRQVAGVPPYTGDASNSFATLGNGGNERIGIASFDPKDNQLLYLSAILNNSQDPIERENTPIRDGDYLELPGGRLVPIYFQPFSGNANDPIQVRFDLAELYPQGMRDLSHNPRIKYRIHRRPVVSNAAPFSLPRGVVIDLNYSGVNGGRVENDFAYAGDLDVPFPKDVEIIFGPDGGVVRVTEGWDNANGVWPTDGIAPLVSPLGQVYLCLGDDDGLRPDDLLSQAKNRVANLMNLDSNWIVINDGTGRAKVAPFAPVDVQAIFQANGVTPNAIVPTPNPDPNSNVGAAVNQVIFASRSFANLSDTVDTE